MKQRILVICTLSLAILSCKKEDEPAPIPNFSFSATNLKAPAKLSFSNLSTNAISYNWQFGDGSTSYVYAPVK